MNGFGFIGCGHMGTVLAAIAAKDKNNDVYVSNRTPQKAEDFAKKYGASVSTNAEIARKCRFVFICVRPQDIETLCEEIAPLIKTRNDVIVVTIAAGVSVAYIKRLLGMSDTPVIRMMPNTPLEVGKGIVLYYCDGVSSSDDSIFKKTFAKSGKLYSIPEELIDAAGCISGCGPAFVYRFITALTSAGEEIGLPPHLAYSLAIKTIEGSAVMAMDGKASADELCSRVCSKGGTTERGVAVIDGSDLSDIISGAAKSSLERTLELKK